MKKLIATILLSLSATTSHAIGPEAVIGALIGGIIIGQAASEPPPPPYAYYPPPPPHASFHGQVYFHQPRPIRQCFTVPLFDAYGRHVRNARQCHYVY